MVTLSIELPTDLAQRLHPYQGYITNVIELGLRQLEQEQGIKPAISNEKKQILMALYSTGLVTLPQIAIKRHLRATPLQVGGIPASELIIAERKAQDVHQLF